MKPSFPSSDIDTLWHLVFGYLRTLGRSHHDAEDLTQEVFHRLAASDLFQHSNSRVKSEAESHYYLYAMARNALRDQHRRVLAVKRGGGDPHVSVDDDDGFAMPSNNTTPADEAELHEVQEHWNRHLTDLAAEAAHGGKQALFVSLQESLNPAHGSADLKRTAIELGLNPVSVRVQASRWRNAMIARVRTTMEIDQAA